MARGQAQSRWYYLNSYKKEIIMEVHHSHHHAGHAKKKFQEYITEFLMLFAAVTLGFFAENKREHYVERAWVKISFKGLISILASILSSPHNYDDCENAE